MNDGKTNGERQAPKLAESKNGFAANTGLEPTDTKRRKLIRGAAGIAPVVLTLRSGSLAAASCVGGVLPVVDVTLLANGEIPSGKTAGASDRCFSTVTACSTDPNKLGGGTPLSPSTVSAITPPGAPGGSGYKCDGGAQGQTVAILSGPSYTSFTGA